MNKVYPERINWEDEPSVATPLSAGNLNKIDYATYEMDNRIIALDANKANQTDELLDIKSVTYNETTGVWTFTHQNGTVDTFDQNIEKIPVAFSMDENGVITMTTADGTTYTCDVSTLIKTITFVNSGNIQFTVTTDAQGNKSVTANIIDGSVTRAKLDPDYLAQIDLDVASASASATAASGSATTASNKALDSEAYAIGTRGGVPVTSDDPAFENNSKYYAEHGASSLAGLTDVNISGVTNGQVIKYNSVTQKWENDDESGGGGILPHLIVISETGSTVTATKGQTVITATETSTGHFECDLPEFGTWTIDAILGGDDAQVSLVVDTVKVYTVDDSHFHATLTVKYPSGATCNLAGQGESYYATGSPYTFTVHHAGQYTITVVYDGVTYTENVTITTTGETFTKKVPTPSSAPANDINWWLWFGDVSGTFSTLADILADSTALATLMASTDAVDYLVRCKEWINKALVPTMTSNTTPSGECISSGIYSAGFEAYKAFDGNDSTKWSADGSTNKWVGYIFPNATKVGKVFLQNPTDSGYSPQGVKTFKIQYSDNGTDWTDATDTKTIAQAGNLTVDIEHNNAHRYWRMLELTMYSANNYATLSTLQFYPVTEGIPENQSAMSYIGLNNYCANTLLADEDWLEGICNSAYIESVLQIKVPTMTSATTPSGVCSAYGGTHGSSPAWLAFDGDNTTACYVTNGVGNGIGYQFTQNVTIKVAYVLPSIADTFKLQVSSDGTTWVDVATFVGDTTNGSYVYGVNTNSFPYARIIQTTKTDASASWEYYYTVQFYGREDV